MLHSYIQVEHHKAVILHGSRGCGKTQLARGLAEYIKVRDICDKNTVGYMYSTSTVCVCLIVFFLYVRSSQCFHQHVFMLLITIMVVWEGLYATVHRKYL